MKYIITPTQFDKIIDLFLNKKVGKNPWITKSDNPYREGSYQLKIANIKNKQMLFNFIFTAAGDSWDDPTDKIYPANGTLYIQTDLLKELSGFLNVRETKALDLIADWFTTKYNVDVDEVHKSTMFLT